MRARYFTRNLSQEEAAFATLVANYDGYKRVLSPGAMPTLTQSGLLAVLLGRQHHKAMHSAWRLARREKIRAGFWKMLAGVIHPHRIRTHTHDSAKPLMGTIPRHT
jgi:hypothetical protein